MRGVGKSTSAVVLGEKLNWPVFDTDKILLEQFNKTRIGELHQELGEELFRREEVEVLKNLQRAKGSVISVGGGVVVTPLGRKIVQTLGDLICIHLDKGRLLKRWERLPQFAPKIESFDIWYEERMRYLQMVSATWVDSEKDNWIEEVVQKYGE